MPGRPGANVRADDPETRNNLARAYDDGAGRTAEVIDAQSFCVFRRSMERVRHRCHSPVPSGQTVRKL